MDNKDQTTNTYTSVEITDEEHALILMVRMMRLNAIIHVMALNNFFPTDMPQKYNHITNIINLHFETSYQVHTIKTVVEFISAHPGYNQMFQQSALEEMIEKYQNTNIDESNTTCELYLKPFTTQCIQCKQQLRSAFTHRSKTSVSLTRTYKARK